MQINIYKKKECKARVDSVYREKFTVVMEPAEFSESSSCKNCNLCSGKSKITKTFNIRKKPDVTEGELIKVTYTLINEAIAALLLLGIPVIFLVSSLILINILSDAGTDNPQSVLISLVTAAAGLVPALCIEKRIRKRSKIVISSC